MENVFMSGDKKGFDWSQLGDIEIGRGDLGAEMPVLLYRLMQYTIVDVLNEELGLQRANGFLRSAGYLAGTEFAKNVLNTALTFDAFISHLQEQLRLLKIGILRMEHYDHETGEIILTIEEDLDCSGLPLTGETVCVYDEGFLGGVLFIYSGKNYKVKEIDCWATGGRVCRFRGVIE